MKRSTKTMTLNLNMNENELDAVQELARKKGMDTNSLVKQALRLYQTAEVRISNGEALSFENPVGKDDLEHQKIIAAAIIQIQTLHRQPVTPMEICQWLKDYVNNPENKKELAQMNELINQIKT